MARILDYPAVKQINSRQWQLLEDLEYHIGSEDGPLITVPSGYETDFASVPKALWSVFPPFGRYSPAAVIHDYLYGSQGAPLTIYEQYANIENGKHSAMRKLCDKIFLEAMEVMEVNWITRHTMYRAVRMFGFINY